MGDNKIKFESGYWLLSRNLCGFFLSVCPDEREITCYIDRTTSSQNLPIIIHLPVLFEAAQHCRQAAHLIDMRSSKS